MIDTEKKIEECNRKINELKNRMNYCKMCIGKNQEEIKSLENRHQFLDCFDKANTKTQKNIEELNKELEEVKNQIPDFNEETYFQYKKYFELENELNIESKSRDGKNEMKVLLKKEEELKNELCCLYYEEAKHKRELCLLHAEQEKLEKKLAKENI